MKQVSVFLAVALVGCSQRAVQPVSTVVGARELVQIGTLLFVTSSERSQLRVLDLDPGPLASQPRQYVRAPNPLEPLAIPVLNRPTMLSADVSWGRDDGAELHGPLVYVASNGSAELSIVSAEVTQLVELVRLPVSAPITAVAGLFDRVKNQSQLYYATFDGSQAQLMVVTLPAPSDLASMPVSDLVKSVQLLATAPRTVFNDVIVLPGNRLALAERTAQGAAGGTFVLDLADLSMREMNFGAPVRTLFTNARVPDSLHEGDRLYGILDEGFCADSSCSGVLSVDIATGQISLDASGHPMLPISVGAGLAISLSLVPGGRLNSPVGDGGYEVQPRQILGVTTASDGSIVYWEAGGLLPIDTNPNPPTALNGGFFDPLGNQVDTTLTKVPPGPFTFNDDGSVDFSSIRLADGAARDEDVAVVVEGLISGLDVLPYDGGVTVAAVGMGERAAVGDVAVFNDASGTACAMGSVTAVSADAIEVTPQACGTQLGVRAVGAQPYVVTGTVSGYFFRSGPGQTASFAGSYRYHTSSFDPTKAQMTITFGPSTGLARDSKWQFTVDDGYRPFAIQVDPASAGCATNFPGGVVAVESLGPDKPLAKTFTAFPSGNGIVETDNTLITPSILTTSIFCYR